MTSEPLTLYVGSGNAHKVREIRAVLSTIGLKVNPLTDLGPLPHVEEAGQTFAENATLKARTFATRFGVKVLADDSGIVVDALDGKPGVHSARFAGLPSDDQANNQKLMNLLSGVPQDQRTARYVCALVLADPQGVLCTAQGTCEGTITTAPQGTAGFGYDPYFLSADLGQTFASVPEAQKNKVSHRARALEALLETLNKQEAGHVG